MALKFIRLTRNAARRLEPGGTITGHGIVFQRLANGDGRYNVNIMVDGRRVHRAVGKESDGVPRQQAEDFIEKVKTEARQDRLGLPRGRKMGLTFREAADKYLKKLAAEGGKDLAKKGERLRLHMVPFFKRKALYFGLTEISVAGPAPHGPAFQA